MSADLQEFNDIIEDLKSHVSQVDFDSYFKEATQDVPKSKQFLIKMELKRLSQPSNKLIDLRGNVAGNPEPYDHKGQIHYLDPLGRQIFEEQVDKFGRYTVGVNEAVLKADNNNRVIHRKEQEAHIAEVKRSLAEEKKPKSIKPKPQKVYSEFGGDVVHFSQYGIRQEERMNFSINVELQFSIGDVLKASTSDLSVSGAKVKIPADKPVIVGQKVALYLTGLEQEYQLGLKDGIQYEIVGIDKAGDDQVYIRLKRSFMEDVTSFDDFLSNFINGNKRRYKVNLENTLSAVVSKAFEQFYLPRITSLPIFFRQIGERTVPTLILATENNRETLGYFSDENKNLVFQKILDEKRLTALANSNRSVKQTLLYSFTHAKAGKLFFYSATQEELAQDEELKQLFIGFGCRKPSWQVFNVHLAESNEKDSFVPLSIPDSAGKEIAKLNTPPSPRVKGMLAGLKYMVTLTPLNAKQHAETYQQNYHFDQSMVNKLQVFGHPKLKRYISINVETIEYVNLRSEERYLYKSAVEVTKTGEEMSFVGSTRDFSVHGLQLVLDETSSYKKGDVVLLAMPEFQNITKKFKLNKLPYEVMAISKDKTVINLRVFDATGKHPAQDFFRMLINQNRSKLTPAKMESRFPGLSKCLRNLTAKSVSNLPIYFAKENNKLKLATVAQTAEPNLLFSLLSHFRPENHDVTLFPLLSNKSINSVYTPTINGLKRTDRPASIELFIRYRVNKLEEQEAFICHYGEHFANEEELKQFVDITSKQDIFCAYRIFISRTGRPDMSYVNKELSYIGNYAIHRAKEIEERLWGIVGIGDVIDISEEVMTRFGYDSQKIEQQRELKEQVI